MNKIVYCNNIDFLKKTKDKSINLIYIDPPFNTGKNQKRTSIKTIRSKDGDRIGYNNNTYKTKNISTMQYVDKFDNFLNFIKPRLEESYRILQDNGSLFFHIDYREVHYCKILLDNIFGRENFMNEIIWAYDYGAKSKKRWSTKHDNILWYVKNNNDYIFNYEDIDRIPYMAPSLVNKEKAERGKVPTDCWWHTIVPTNSKEKTGYPTQKPCGILRRIIKVHSNENDIILDYFAGSGTTGIVANELNRKFILIDNNLEAINVMKKRFKNISVEFL